MYPKEVDMLSELEVSKFHQTLLDALCTPLYVISSTWPLLVREVVEYITCMIQESDYHEKLFCYHKGLIINTCLESSPIC